MGLLDDLGQLLQQVTSGQAQERDVHAAYDQVATRVPSSELAGGIADAFRSDQTPPFEQMLSGIFSQSSGEQKAGILNQVLTTLGSGGVAPALAFVMSKLSAARR